MRIRAPHHLLVASLVLVTTESAAALEPVLMKESISAEGNLGTPCLLNGNTNGTAANYRWYNTCSGYIWLYGDWDLGEGVGVLFGGADQPAVAPGNTVKRVITYYRNIFPVYTCRIEVALDRDIEGDGCPDGVIASECFEPAGLRWNCSEFGAVIPPATPFVIVRQTRANDGGWNIDVQLATDGPFSSNCDPVGTPRSFYYGVDGTCQPWDGPTSRNDNFLTWLVVDGEVPNATQSMTWGAIKGLYR